MSFIDNDTSINEEKRELNITLGNINISAHFKSQQLRSEEHTSELQSRGLISYAVFFLTKKKINSDK